MASDAGDIALPVDELIASLTKSFTSAAERLKVTMAGPEWKDSPFIYHMPGMTMEIRLTLTVSGNTVKGIVNKTKTESSQETSSMIRLELVSVPNSNVSGKP
jgi:hypothetical protein